MYFPILEAARADSPHNPSAQPHPGHPNRRGLVRRLFLVTLVGLGLAAAGRAAEPPAGEFGKDIRLAPFVVRGKALTISVHARNKGDRRYAEQFAEGVVKVVYESVTEETGKGLVIIGKKGEPHPIVVFRQFLAFAEEGKLDPAVAARAPELDRMLHHWQDMLGDGSGEGDGSGDAPDLEFERIVAALPLPLEGIGAKLYQLAWREEFVPARVEAKLRALQPADLEGNLFARFDWVFYLPPRGAFEAAINGILADALKEEGAGFFTRTAVKGVMLAVKPAIRKAIEGLRRGVLFSTVVKAGTDYSPDEAEKLVMAYIEAVFPKEKRESGSEHERAVRAVRTAVEALAAEDSGRKPAEEGILNGQVSVPDDTKGAD